MGKFRYIYLFFFFFFFAMISPPFSELYISRSPSHNLSTSLEIRAKIQCHALLVLRTADLGAPLIYIHS